MSRTIDYIDAMYCYLYGKYFDNICFVSIRENCLIFVRVFTHESSVRSTQRCKDSSFLITSELVVAPIISRFVSPDVFVFFCVLQKRKTSSGFISTKRLDFHEISWPCCIHQFEKILSIVAFTARDFSFILHRGWDIFIMYYFRYIYIYIYYTYIIYSIYRDIDLWIGRISIFIGHFRPWDEFIWNQHINRLYKCRYTWCTSVHHIALFVIKRSNWVK